MSRKKTVAVDAEVIEAPVTTVTHSPADAAPAEPLEKSHAAGIEKKKYAPPPNPFSVINGLAGQNHVQLLKSETEAERQRGRGEGAWVIRFAHNPNDDKGPNGETFGSGNPHPVLKLLKAEGYSWNWDVDGKPGWGKLFNGDPYGADYTDARRVLQQARELLGQPKEQGVER